MNTYLIKYWELNNGSAPQYREADSLDNAIRFLQEEHQRIAGYRIYKLIV